MATLDPKTLDWLDRVDSPKLRAAYQKSADWLESVEKQEAARKQASTESATKRLTRSMSTARELLDTAKAQIDHAKSWSPSDDDPLPPVDIRALNLSPNAQASTIEQAAIAKHRHDMSTQVRSDLAQKIEPALATAVAAIEVAGADYREQMAQAQRQIRTAVNTNEVSFEQTEIANRLNQPLPGMQTRVERMRDLLDEAEAGGDPVTLKATRRVLDAEAGYLDGLNVRGGTDSLLATDIQRRLRDLQETERAPVNEARANLDQLDVLRGELGLIVSEAEETAGVPTRDPALGRPGAWEQKYLGAPERVNGAGIVMREPVDRTEA